MLGERRYRRMAERPIGLTRHAGEVVLRNGITHEGPDHINRHLGIGPPGKARDRFAVEKCEAQSGEAQKTCKEQADARLESQKANAKAMYPDRG